MKTRGGEIPLVAAFSLNMLENIPSTMRVTEIPAVVVSHMNIYSQLGDSETAHMYNRFMEAYNAQPLTANRAPLRLCAGDACLWANYQGPRPHGMTEADMDRIPENSFRFKFMLVEVL